MKKVPTLFRRDPDDLRHLLPEITPGCEWVLVGEGAATRKYDGTCVMFDGEDWWARREVKPGKDPPANWVKADHDEVTGKRVGWEPANQGPFWKFHQEAIGGVSGGAGTYELIGPKIQSNPEHVNTHMLMSHADADRFPDLDHPQGYDQLAEYLTPPFPWEGIVWHHPDGRMAKLKRRDFK